jgi:hypothetical protein
VKVRIAYIEDGIQDLCNDRTAEDLQQGPCETDALRLRPVLLGCRASRCGAREGVNVLSSDPKSALSTLSDTLKKREIDDNDNNE